MAGNIFARIACSCGRYRIIRKSEAQTYYDAETLLKREGWETSSDAFVCPSCKNDHDPDMLPF